MYTSGSAQSMFFDIHYKYSTALSRSDDSSPFCFGVTRIIASSPGKPLDLILDT